MDKYILLKNVSTRKYKLQKVNAEEIDNDCFIYILGDDLCINDELTGMLVCKENKNNENSLLTYFYSLLPRLRTIRKSQKYYNRMKRYKNYLKKL